MHCLFILNDPPYGTERCYNALRVAHAIIKKNPAFEVTVLGSALARRGARVTGLDSDPQMLAAAHRRAQSESIELHLVRGRAEALPFEDETFDRVVAVAVLCFVRETDRAISEVARGLNVNRTVGAIYYPPIGTAALLLGRFDSWGARWTSIGAAFIAVLASKPALRARIRRLVNVRRSRGNANSE